MKDIQERVDEYRAKVNEKLDGLPEAGAIVYSTIYAGNFPINLTQRANNVYDAYVAFKMGVDLLGEVFGVTLEKDIPQAAPPIMQQMKPETAAAFKTVMSKKDELDDAFGEPVYEEIPDGIESSEVTSINILPQPDNKVTIEFVKEGLKWPVAKINKWPVDRVQEFLSEVTSEDVTKPAEVKVNCIVFWKQGKEFAPGKHYKDILKVTA